MSVRSLWSAFFSAIAVTFLFAAAAPALAANSCAFGCTVNYIQPPLTGSLTSCTNDTQCADFCSATCSALGSTPAARPDAAHPSTCGTASPRACTPCTCVPQTITQCNGSDTAGTCASQCGTTCGTYNSNRPRGVASITCGTGPTAPRCVEPQAPAPTAAGHCQYACSFGPTRIVRTPVMCTPSSPSECTGDLNSYCTDLGLEPTQPSTATRQCRPGEGGNKCAITCNRPTAVSETDRGTCTAGAQNNECSARCDQVCGRRGMVCDTANAATCDSSSTPAKCNFRCAVATTNARQDDTATSCDASVSQFTQTCVSRCAAFCSERGGTCASDPVPICTSGANSPSGGTTNNSGNSGSSGGSGATRQPSRTAPVFRVTFPDPFGGTLTAQAVIGNIIRIAIALCGVFFIGVFVYGGLLYMTSAGDAKDVKKGQGAIVNAVIGLVVVLVAYVAVSLIIQLSDQFQTSDITGIDQSQNALDQDPTTLQPGGTTRATGRSSQGGTASQTTGAPAPEAGTPSAACRSYYNADPATCAASRGGPCPNGVSDLSGLMTAWGRSFGAPTTMVTDPAAQCRNCLETGIRGMQGLYPGLTTSCVPALVNMWSTTCHDACNPQTVMQTGGGSTGADLCVAANYNTANASCSRCVTYWSQASRSSTIDAVGCSDVQGKALIWCSTTESPSQTSRPQSGGFCVFSSPRR